MAITAKQVNELRQATGAGMMDCKKALTEAGGDFEKAIEYLRKKGQKVSASRADRDATEGAVFTVSNEDDTEALLVELNCETDFVAKNDDFQNLGKSIAELALANKPADIDALKSLPLGSATVAEELVSAMGRIGEKIDIRNYEILSGDKVVSYIHGGGKVGVIAAFEGVGSADIDTVSKDVAMQIAAMRPIAVDESGVAEDVKEREMRIGREQALAEGKPENIIDRIAEGKLNKFYKENTLVHQAFVKDSSKNVGQVLKEVNPGLKVKAFKRIGLGGN